MVERRCQRRGDADRAQQLVAAAGFTLIELMVVLGIMGIMIVAIAPARFSAGDGLELRAAARAIVDGLQRTRSLAVSSGTPTLFAIDVDRRLIQAADAKAPVALPPQARLSLRTVRGAVADRSVGGIRFFPDGGSTGGGITIGAASGEYRIAVAWLTGRVEIVDAP